MEKVQHIFEVLGRISFAFERRLRNLALLTCFSLLLIFSANVNRASAQTHLNTISGHIFNDQRQPLQDVYVELLNETNGIVARIKTTGGGGYIFRGLSGGTFTVKALPYGTDLEEQSAEVNIETDGVPGRSPSANAQQDFYLRLRRDRRDANNVTGTLFVQDVPEDAQKLYEKAIESLNRKDAAQGITALESALTAFPTYYVALIRLGQEYGALQKWTQAYDTLKRAVAINPKSFTGWYGLSSAASGAQMVEESVKAAEVAVSLNATSVEASLLLGVVQRKAKQYLAAEKTLSQADKLAKGKSADVHWNLALLYAHNLNKFAAAADHLELYLKVVPKTDGSDNVKKLIKEFRNKASNNN